MVKAPANSIHPQTRTEWRTWLKHNHTRAKGVWLISYKKDTGKPRFEYDEAVEEALCFGWIDSKPSKLDDERSMLWVAPRQAGAGWSKINKARVEKMNQASRMTPARSVSRKRRVVPPKISAPINGANKDGAAWQISMMSKFPGR